MTLWLINGLINWLEVLPINLHKSSEKCFESVKNNSFTPGHHKKHHIVLDVKFLSVKFSDRRRTSFQSGKTQQQLAGIMNVTILRLLLNYSPRERNKRLLWFSRPTLERFPLNNVHAVGMLSSLSYAWLWLWSAHRCRSTSCSGWSVYISVCIRRSTSFGKSNPASEKQSSVKIMANLCCW